MIHRVDLQVKLVNTIDVIICIKHLVGAGILESPGPLLTNYLDHIFRLGGWQGLLDFVPDKDCSHNEHHITDDHENVRNADPLFLVRFFT